MNFVKTTTIHPPGLGIGRRLYVTEDSATGRIKKVEIDGPGNQKVDITAQYRAKPRPEAWHNVSDEFIDDL